jgi:hypothetical protein
MRLRTFFILCTLTVAAVIAAAVAVVREQRPETVAGAGSRVFPALLEQVNGLSAVRIRGGGNILTVRKVNTHWGLEQRHDYPVRAEKLRDLVVGLARLERIEPKTSKPELFARLQLEDIDLPQAKSKEVTLIGSNGQPLAQILVGAASAALGQEGAFYARLPGEEHAWLVRGAVGVSLDVGDWLETEIVNVPADEVQRVEIRHGDGAAVVAERASRDAPYLSLQRLPEGATVKSESATGPLASLLSSLELEDVRPASEVNFVPAGTTTAMITTFDGVTFVLDVTERDGGRWVKIGVEQASPSDGREPDARFANISGRTRDWVYRIPSWKVTPLESRIEDYLATERNGS